MDKRNYAEENRTSNAGGYSKATLHCQKIRAPVHRAGEFVLYDTPFMFSWFLDWDSCLRPRLQYRASLGKISFGESGRASLPLTKSPETQTEISTTHKKVMASISAIVLFDFHMQQRIVIARSHHKCRRLVGIFTAVFDILKGFLLFKIARPVVPQQLPHEAI